MIKPTLFAALLAAGLPAAALAQDAAPQAYNQLVRYSDLDLTDAADAAVLKSRIEHAARRVCGRKGRELPQVRRMIKACNAAAVRAAVEQVDAPALSAMYNRDTAVRLMASL